MEVRVDYVVLTQKTFKDKDFGIHHGCSSKHVGRSFILGKTQESSSFKPILKDNDNLGAVGAIHGVPSVAQQLLHTMAFGIRTTFMQNESAA